MTVAETYKAEDEQSKFFGDLRTQVDEFIAKIEAADGEEAIELLGKSTADIWVVSGIDLRPVVEDRLVKLKSGKNAGKGSSGGDSDSSSSDSNSNSSSSDGESGSSSDQESGEREQSDSGLSCESSPEESSSEQSLRGMNQEERAAARMQKKRVQKADKKKRKDIEKAALEEARRERQRALKALDQTGKTSKERRGQSSRISTSINANDDEVFNHIREDFLRMTRAQQQKVVRQSIQLLIKAAGRTLDDAKCDELVELLESKCFESSYQKVDDVYKTRVQCVRKNMQYLIGKIENDDQLAIYANIVERMLILTDEKGNHQINPQRLTLSHQEFVRMVATIEGRLRQAKARP